MYWKLTDNRQTVTIYPAVQIHAHTVLLLIIQLPVQHAPPDVEENVKIARLELLCEELGGTWTL